MRKVYVSLVISVVVVLLAGVSVNAQPRPGMMWRGSGGWGLGSPYDRMYDPKAVENISGEVAGVSRITPRKGMVSGVHVSLKTDKETVSVHLGPGWYLENQDVKIEPKDKIEVKGSRITFGGKPAIIAAEVKKGDRRAQAAR